MIFFSSSSIWLLSTLLFLNGITALSPPTCQIYAPLPTFLPDVRSANLTGLGDPFGLVYAKHGNVAFASEGGVASLTVLNTSAFVPSVLHRVALPDTGEGDNGITLTRDGRHVLVATGGGIVIVDAQRAEAGNADAVVGYLNGTVGSQKPGDGAIEVTVSLDNRYAFVSQEYGIDVPVDSTPGNIDVFELYRPSRNGSVSGRAIGFVNLGYLVVGTALSPDGRLLYATSQTNSIVLSTAASYLRGIQGSLIALDVHTLVTAPGPAAMVGNATAGCGADRVIVSADGEMLWVTARESNALLAFDAKKLLTSSNDSLIAVVQVGESPVGLTFVKNETRILTADSNRFGFKNETTGLSVVDVQAALSGSGKAVLGSIPTGSFPREFAVSPDGSTVLVAQYDSHAIQAIDVSTIP